MKMIVTLALVFCCQIAFAQPTKTNTTKPVIDTAAVLDSLQKDFDIFSKGLLETSSYFNVNAGIGNRLFSKSNPTLNSQQAESKTTIFTPGLGYYYKNGLSLSGTAYLDLNETSVGFYQYSITPAFDFSNSSKVGFGVSYTAYLTKAKDTLPNYATPYDHEFFAYVASKQGTVQPGLNVGFATGKYTSIFKGRITGPLGSQVFVVDTQQNKISDISVSATLQHDFEFENIIGKNDGLSLTPMLLLNAGSGKSEVLKHSNKLVNNIIASRKNNRFKPDNYSFSIQSVALSFDLLYSVGKFYVEPQLYLDYYLKESTKKFSTVFSLTAGFNF